MKPPGPGRNNNPPKSLCNPQSHLHNELDLDMELRWVQVTSSCMNHDASANPRKIELKRATLFLQECNNLKICTSDPKIVTLNVIEQ